jgi:O-antigen/teichoic acid export membrane protein
MLVTVPHFLTATNFGVFSLAGSYIGYFVLIGSLGTGTFLVKAIARDSSLVGVYVFNAVVMKLLLAMVLSGAALLLAKAIGYPEQTITVIAILCIGMGLTLLNDVLRAGLQGLERMGKQAAWAVVQVYVCSGLALAALVRGHGVVAFALIVSSTGIIAVIGNGAQLWAQMRSCMRIDIDVWRSIAIGGFPFLLWASVLVIYGTIDIPIIQAFAGSATVGLYALAYAWVAMPAAFSGIVATAVLPGMSAKAKGSPQEFAVITNHAIRLVMFAGIPASAGIALVAPDVFALFHYQAGFQNAIVLVQILAVHIPVVGMDIVLGSALIASDRQKEWTLIGCIAAIFNPLVNLAAIPMTMRLFHNGAVGASVVTVATEVLMMLGAIHLRPSGVLDHSTTMFVVKCILATGAMIPAVVALSGAGLAVKVAIGVVTYIGTSIVLRTASKEALRLPPAVPELQVPELTT